MFEGDLAAPVGGAEAGAEVAEPATKLLPRFQLDSDSEDEQPEAA